MGLKRLVLLVLLALMTTLGVASDASAGGIRDWEPCPDQSGTLVCPEGEVGIPYTIKFRAVEEPPCSPGDDFWYVKSGSAPTGLSLASDGTLSGTPSEAGTWAFWVEMKLPDNETCNGTADTTQERFSITIRPGVPKLTIGPEQAGVPVGTVGTAFRLQMTANLPDAKTWSIADGALPPGTAIDSASGVISGTPSTAGTYVFTVQAVIGSQQSDTKTLAITVREQVKLEVVENPDAAAGVLPGAPSYEVGVPISLGLTASGGTGTFTWSISGRLPRGVTFLQTGGLTGRPRQAGTFRFLVTVRDTEGRTAAYNGAFAVAPRLAIKTRRLQASKVDKIYMANLKTRGGVAPVEWKLVRGKLPDGVWLDWASGTILGLPVKAGLFRFRIQAIDAFGVKSTRNYLVRVFPAPKKNR